MGIVLVELLLCDCYDRRMSFPLAARALVDEHENGAEGADELAAAIKGDDRHSQVVSLLTKTVRATISLPSACKEI